MVGLLLLSFLLAGSPPVELERLVRESRATAGRMADNGGLPQELLRNREAIVTFGEQAISMALPHLKDPNPVVRRFFGSVLEGLPGLTERELPALIAAYRGGNRWVVGAIASIRTPKAISFLAGEFERAPQGNEALAWHLGQFGPAGVQALLQPLNRDAPVRDHFAASACGGVRELGAGGTNVGAELLVTLASEMRPVANRKAALWLLGCVPPLSASERVAVDGAVTASKALQLDKNTSLLQVTLGTPEGVRIIMRRLAKQPEYVAALVAAGQSARIAEPAVLSLTDHPTANIRLEAVKALGAIGGDPSIARLELALTDDTDWQIPCAAARSLVTLKANSKLSALRAAARTAWYPPTAECIDAAGKALESGVVLSQQRKWEVPDGSPWRVHPVPRAAARTEELSERQRAALRVTGAVRSWSERGPLTESVVGPPSVALALDGGFLLGTNRGEWGGELVWSSGGKQRPLLEENIVGIHRLGGRLIVVTGLAHLGINEGAVFRVEFAADSTPHATEWRILPGVPEGSFVLENGRLFLPCKGGDVVLDETGNLAMATPELVQ
ncbi:MAG: hypothetical protein Q8L48_15840 [Archangium sp.]|nr:hypothetical protein [Archangium sp.]